MEKNLGPYRMNSAPDLLNSLPALFGFVPDQSLIVLLVLGEANHIALRLRVDLPAAGDIAETAQYLAQQIGRFEHDRLVVITLGDDPLHAEEVLIAVVERLAEFRVARAIWATSDRYWELGPDHEPSGHHYAFDEHHETRVRAVIAGHRVAASRSEVVAEFEPVSQERQVALAHQAETIAERVSSDEGRGSLRWSRPLDLVDGALLNQQFADSELLELSIWLGYAHVRDLLWTRIHHGNARGQHQLWTQVSRIGNGDARSTALTMAAFAAWLSGDGARALIAVEAALATVPGHSLANTMQKIVLAGIDPQLWNSRG